MQRLFLRITAFFFSFIEVSVTANITALTPVGDHRSHHCSSELFQELLAPEVVQTRLHHVTLCLFTFTPFLQTQHTLLQL